MHLAVDAHDMPVRMLVAADAVAACSQVCRLIEGIGLEICWLTKGMAMMPCGWLGGEWNALAVPSRKRRKTPRD